MHAVFSASGSNRWINCPGSVELIKRVDFHEPSSPNAEEGTQAHGVLEALITNSEIPSYANEDMIYHAKEAVEFIKSLGIPIIPENAEKRITIDWLIPGQFGTSDYWYYDEQTKTVYAIDYKYGFGVVEVENNSQLTFYSMDDSIWEEFQNVVAVIIQPRAYHPDGAFRVWKATRMDIMKVAAKMEQAYKRAQLAAAPLTTGSHCKYCKARGNCPAIHERIDILKTILDAEPPLNGEQLGKRLAQVQELSELVGYAKSSLETQAMYKINAGDTIEGYAVVPNIGRRVLKDEKTLTEIAPMFGVDLNKLYERKLKPLGKLEKELPKAIVEVCTEKPNNGFKLVQSEVSTSKAQAIFGEYNNV